MKRNILAAIAVIASAGALAQGTINMNSYPSITGARQNVLDADNVTPLAGAAFWVQMYAGPSASSLAPVGAAINFATGSAAGLFRTDVARTVGTVTPGADAFVQIAAWETGFNTVDEAMNAGKKWGKSTVFTVKTGGDGNPPALPGNMTNFKGFALIPEPSTIALGLLGAASLLFFRRK